MMLAAAPATATASSGRPSATAVPPTPSFAARAGAPVRRAAAATPSVVARAAAGPGPLAATVKDGRVGGDASPVAGLRFDFVVVGGGAAGCVLANRLSADPSKSVLLLEAGGESKGERLISTPVGISRLFRSHFDYNLYTERSEHPAEIDPTTKEGREMYLARGRVLGGSSATNATLYHRGSASDYDAWGVPGWSAADLLPWFRHAEGNRRTAGVKNDPNWRAHHGADGPLPVEDPRFHCALHDRFLDACREMGMSDNRDFNDWSRSQEGFGSFQVTQRRGVRGDAASSYLEPVRSRPNLVVVSQAVASRVAWEGEEEAGGSPRTGDGAPRAAGVFFSQPQLTGRSSFLARLSAGGEVVLAAGAVGTPQLLMLSGVGPADHLREVGVPRVVVDSPRVGRDLQDHPATLTAHAIVKREAMTDLMYTRGGRVRAAPLLRYALTGSGPAASTGCDRGAFVKTDPSLAEPDVQIRYVPALSIDADGVSSYAAFDRLRGRGKGGGGGWPSGVTFQVVACRPKSRGSVRLRTASAHDAPRVTSGYLSDPEGADARSMLGGVAVARQLAATGAFKNAVTEEVHPGTAPADDAALEDFVRRHLHSANAVVGTVAMGAGPSDGRPGADGADAPPAPGEAPVDARLRVRGTRGLRVVDASVFPLLPGGQTGAPTVALAERAADLLLSGELRAPPTPA